MPAFGIDKVIYHCPRLDKDVVISLYYGVYEGNKVYHEIDCQERVICETEKKYDWLKCPGHEKYKKYIIGDYH